MVSFFVILLAAGLVYFLKLMRDDTSQRRSNIRDSEKTLALTNKLITEVNEAQHQADIFIANGNTKSLKTFISLQKEIKTTADSLSISFSEEKLTIDTLSILLKKKEKSISNIARHFETFNPYDEIYAILSKHTSEQKPEIKSTTQITTTKQDTVIVKKTRRGFGRRFLDLFSSSEEQDSVIITTTTTIDSVQDIRQTDIDTTAIFSDIREVTEKGTREQIKRMEKMRKQYESFINNDRNINEELTKVLLLLHQNAIKRISEDISKSEEDIDHNISISTYGTAIVLSLIILFIILIFSNIHRLAKAKRETEQAKRQVEKLMDSRHKLLLSVSHDIKAPLSSIIGNIELMHIDAGDDEKQRLGSMQESAAHILDLLTNLLDFSSLEQGNQTLSISQFNAYELCESLIHMFSPIAMSRKLGFVTQNEIDKTVLIKSDPLKIKQILTNLLSNAFKYTLHGNVEFQSFLYDNKLVFKVNDEGIGIDKDKLEDIYEPFSRINSKNMTEGNGFGLYVVKGLVELLQGTIEVWSETGAGTRFRVEIPVETIDSENIIKKDIKKILVIDDDANLLAVILAMLKRIEIEAETCCSKAEFDEVLDKISQYDAVITDREMGALSGNDILKAVKAKDEESIVILMTARTEYSDVLAKSQGFDGYLRKPFTINDLITLFHCNEVEMTKKKSRFSKSYPILDEMFGGDEAIIEQILNTFAETTADNLVFLNKSIDTHSFSEAKSICHRMKPMFIQLQKNELAEFLTKMEQSDEFEYWEQEALTFMEAVDKFLAESF